MQPGSGAALDVVEAAFLELLMRLFADTARHDCPCRLLIKVSAGRFER